MTFADRLRSVQQRTSSFHPSIEVNPKLTSEICGLDQAREVSNSALIKVCIGADEALSNIIGQKKTNMQRKEINSSEVKSGMKQLTDDLQRLRLARMETKDQLAEMKASLKVAEESVTKTGNQALGFVEESDHVPALRAKKNVLYQVTRVCWDRVSKHQHLVEGFVLNQFKQDVSTFKIDRRDPENTSFYRNLVWDFIGAGVHPAWKNLNL